MQPFSYIFAKLFLAIISKHRLHVTPDRASDAPGGATWQIAASPPPKWTVPRHPSVCAIAHAIVCAPQMQRLGDRGLPTRRPPLLGLGMLMLSVVSLARP
jgi:hypothetical protein